MIAASEESKAACSSPSQGIANAREVRHGKGDKRISVYRRHASSGKEEHNAAKPCIHVQREQYSNQLRQVVSRDRNKQIECLLLTGCKSIASKKKKKKKHTAYRGSSKI
jgi:hypothetical protein